MDLAHGLDPVFRSCTRPHGRNGEQAGTDSESMVWVSLCVRVKRWSERDQG